MGSERSQTGAELPCLTLTGVSEVPPPRAMLATCVEALRQETEPCVRGALAKAFAIMACGPLATDLAAEPGIAEVRYKAITL